MPSFLITFQSFLGIDLNCSLMNSWKTLAQPSKIKFLVVLSSQCGYFARCCLENSQQFPIRERSRKEAQLKTYLRLFFLLYTTQIIFRLWAFLCPLLPSFFNTKFWPPYNQGLNIGSKIWSLYTLNNIFLLIFLGTL